MNYDKAAVARYYIKEGYLENKCAATFEGENPGAYWNEKRISLNATSRIYVYYYVRALIKKGKFKRYLDLGCGPALKVKDIIWPIIKDITLIDQPSLHGIVANIFPEAKFIGLDLEKSDFQADAPFDIIVSSDVIEHLTDPTHYLSCIKNNLAKNGVAVITTPERDYFMGSTCMKSSNKSHVREWNSKELKMYLESAGFFIEKQFYCPLIPLPFWEYKLSRLMAGFFKNKRWSSCQIVYCRHKNNNKNK